MQGLQKTALLLALSLVSVTANAGGSGDGLSTSAKTLYGTYCAHSTFESYKEHAKNTGIAIAILKTRGPLAINRMLDERRRKVASIPTPLALREYFIEAFGEIAACHPAVGELLKIAPGKDYIDSIFGFILSPAGSIDRKLSYLLLAHDYIYWQYHRRGGDLKSILKEHYQYLLAEIKKLIADPRFRDMVLSSQAPAIE